MSFAVGKTPKVTPQKDSLFIVHSNPPNKWTRDLERGLENTISKETWSRTSKYYFHSVYWLPRSPEERIEEKDRILGVIAASKPTAILLCDDEANDFLVRDLVAFGYPVFTVGVNRLPALSSWNDLVAANKVSGVFETWPVENALNLLEKHFAKRKNFSIITSDTGTSERIIEIIQTPKIQNILKKRGQTIRKIHKLREWEGWKNAIAESNQTDDFIWFLVSYGVFDSDNVEVTPDRIMQWLKNNLRIPSVGSSALLGGVSISIGVMAEQMASEVGKMIQSTFQKEKPFGGHFATDAYKIQFSNKKP